MWICWKKTGPEDTLGPDIDSLIVEILGASTTWQSAGSGTETEGSSGTVVGCGYTGRITRPEDILGPHVKTGTENTLGPVWHVIWLPSLLTIVKKYFSVSLLEPYSLYNAYK